MEEIKQALDLKTELDTLRPLDKEQEDRIMQKFRLDWNYHSNHLEGNTLTYGETKALILFGITAQGKPLKDTLEITGHNDAIDWVLDMIKGERPLTENFIRELHEVLLVKPYEVDAQTPDGNPTKKLIKVGSYKTTPNHVVTKTGEMFYFATPEETPAEMTALLDWYSKKSQEEDVNPILLAAEFHYKFIRIHPFDDGNGRCARILMNFILMKFGFPPAIIKSDTESKAEYFAVLQLADAGSIEPFIDFIAGNLMRSLQIMIAGAKGESIEEPDDLDKEIALLEQRLKNIGENATKPKSKILIRDLIIHSFGRFYENLTNKNNSFEKLYFERTITIDQLNESTNRQVFDKAIFEKLIDGMSIKTLSIVINDKFSKFKTIGFDAFEYNCQIAFNFRDLTYEIYSNGIQHIVKPYDKQLSDSEIDKIVKSEIKRHKEFIEQKIAEKENKK